MELVPWKEPKGDTGQRIDKRGSGAGFGSAVEAKSRSHFGVEEAAAGTVGLDPFSIDNELRDGAFADVGEDFFGGAGCFLDVDFGIGNLVGLEEALGLSLIHI